MPPADAPKNPRKRPSSTDTAPENRKRLRIHDARTIQVQSTSPAVREGSIDVASFIRTRQFEIDALTSAMAASRRASTKRAFQSVPRDMRRRTASHNAQRVPKRLRTRAKKEMKEDNTPTVTFRRRAKKRRDWLRAQTAEKLRNMKGKKEITEKILNKAAEIRQKKIDVLRDPPRPHSKFRKRQRNKTWLPTHVWHAKRAKMEVKWRFAVPWAPNEKVFRPTHRATDVRGAVAWDASYISTILMKGKQDEIENIYGKIFPNNSPPASRIKDGKRSTVAWAYGEGSPIAPVTIIWCPSDASESRKLLLRVHPSAFLQLWKTILNEKESTTVTIEDLRFELGSIEITGPAATNALLSVLTPAEDEETSLSSSSLWASLRGLTTPAVLPSGVVFGLEVVDPRLRFPPRLEPSTSNPEETEARLFSLASTWPLQPIPFALLDSKKRATAVKLQPSQKRISKRKSEAPPGKYPVSIPEDPRIPVVIFSSSNGPKAPCGWTVLLPWKWVQPVWYSLMHTQQHVRFGGVQESQQLCFDHMLPWFPGDFPGTVAGKEEEEARARTRMAEWARRPKGKRTQWDSIKIPEGKEAGEWSRCDWNWLLSLPEQESQSQTQDSQSSNLSMDGMDMDASATQPSAEGKKRDLIWQIPPSIANKILSSSKALPHEGLPLDTSLLSVRIILSHRGSPKDRARIYHLANDTPLTQRWKALAQPQKKRDEKMRIEVGHEQYPPVPPAEDIIGFVTTGNYSLSHGKPVGVGAVAWKKISSNISDRWCVVRDVGSSIGRLAKWEPVVL